jgi:LacI family repressor for deo operon, udp, cdd, tsx, nupC, and nupG
LALGYEPNNQAVSLRKGKTMTIGVIVPELCEPFFSSAANSIDHVADQYGYSVLLAQSHGNIILEGKHIEKMRRFRVDGLIISLGKNTFNYEHLIPLLESRIPLVFFDSVPHMENIHYVTSDPGEAVAKAVSHLYERGHRSIGLLNGSENLFESQKRYLGYMAALDRLSLKPDPKLVINCSTAQAGIEKLIAQLFKTRKGQLP